MLWLFLVGLLALASARIPYDQRKFHSTAIDSVVDNVTASLKDPTLAAMFENCFPNTLDTTVEYFVETAGQEDAFIITGDINAQWLRDSTNQVLPYIPYAKDDLHLRSLLCGLVHRQATEVLNDPFANAFNKDPNGQHRRWRKRVKQFNGVLLPLSHIQQRRKPRPPEGHQDDNVHPPQTPSVFESKYELDSLAAALKLAWNYWNGTGDVSCFSWQDSTGNNWQKSVAKIIDTVTAMQKGTNEEDTNPTYTFQRYTSVATDTLGYGGRGQPVKRTGMSKSLFRPSDDATVLPFLVPSNIMAVVELRHAAQLLNLPSGPTSNPSLAQSALNLANDIDSAIQKFAVLTTTITNSGRTVPAYAYEVDGYGGRVFMDDANIPSLLSIPYLGYVNKLDPVYLNTRELVLSPTDNPYFWSGKAAEGIGGPHVGYGYIWPMSIIMRGITSNSDDEITYVLNVLKNSTANTNFMHESFWKDNPNQYTRSWFAWANSLFGELILILSVERPYLIY